MKLLMLGHEYFGMWEGYSYGFAKAGFDVQVAIYDQRKGLHSNITYAWRVYRQRLLLGTSPYAELRARYNLEVSRALRQAEFQAVVVFSGGLLDAEVFEPVIAKGIPVVMWLEDQLSRLVFLNAEILRRYSAVATFSPRDAAALQAEGVRAEVVPFGFDDRFYKSGRPRHREVVFVGARDSYRADVLTCLASRQIPVRAYGQQWSRNPVYRMRDRSWTRPPVKGGPNVPYAKAKELYWNSLVSLNLHVPSQDLVNPRTFDVCGVAGLQLVDRSNVETFYEPGREILIFKSVEEASELVLRAQLDEVWANRIRSAARERTLAEHTIERRCRRIADLLK